MNITKGLAMGGECNFLPSNFESFRNQKHSFNIEKSKIYSLDIFGNNLLGFIVVFHIPLRWQLNVSAKMPRP
jgi:hypothetical protein